jgi:hypothetical protein
MYTHGSGPDGIDAKVLWWARRNFGGSLRLTGIRLDAPGRFHQTFQQAGTSSTPVGYRAPFPSTVVVPHAGCWLFRLRTGTVAGVVVVQAVDRPG